ncbi:hypothetical protein [Palaeococcus sp. (in: euryarchaeotes)]|uniref:hypothetical protein n=1 Tax=Palaeococcus sp. (in: euryarchaeotes) TaxID=2820298 RepID=UPI0025EA27D6|nr:hypothetical protein [Palaeococcus sp. (in: euryarchaeotes)]
MGGKRAFIFSTVGMPWYNHRALRRALKEKGFQIVGEFSCRGWDTNGWLAKVGGDPNEKDLERARRFAEKLKLKYREY